ncbi:MULTISPECIES: hypothetical protein [Bradyrhizobium]|uniref:hypothetical protein n=1 Tax=Bradyrhizobium TaxID=374 RepID=UPI001FE61BEB|nr:MULTISPECIES: hypothetical protein [Bradyrhizobium]
MTKTGNKTTGKTTDKPSEPPKQGQDKARKPSPRREVDDDDYEDGDIATPKRDRYGPDDEPF